MDGEKSLLPKNNGVDKRVSAFQSRETGFGMEISKQDLEKINAKRNSTDYFDKVAAKDVQNTTKNLHLPNLHLCGCLSVVGLMATRPVTSWLYRLRTVFIA